MKSKWIKRNRTRTTEAKTETDKGHDQKGHRTEREGGEEIQKAILRIDRKRDKTCSKRWKDRQKQKDVQRKSHKKQTAEDLWRETRTETDRLAKE